MKKIVSVYISNWLLLCHCTLGIGHPLAGQCKMSVSPTRTVTLGLISRGRNWGGCALVTGGNTDSCPSLLLLDLLSNVAVHLKKYTSYYNSEAKKQ